jgi:hypothetical protein
MALAIRTVADSVAGITVSGVNIKDLNEIPNEVHNRDAPIVYPEPDGFLSNFRFSRESQGTGTSAHINVRYTLTYTFLHSRVGTGRGLFDVYADMVGKVADFLDGILANDAITGAVDIYASNVSTFGPTADPSGEVFHGCTIQLDVLDFE